MNSHTLKMFQLVKRVIDPKK